MKSIAAILLIVASHSVAIAQNKHNLFIDLGCSNLGVSATYDRKITRHLDLGVGVSAYNFNDALTANIRSAIYADIRPYWVIKRNLLFSFADIGLANNTGRKPASVTISPFGLYTAFGFGYCYQINKRGMGPYVSTGFYGYTVSTHDERPLISPRARDYSVFDASLTISLGFKL